MSIALPWSNAIAGPDIIAKARGGFSLLRAFVLFWDDTVGPRNRPAFMRPWPRFGGVFF
jgi:hypothetical protein